MQSKNISSLFSGKNIYNYFCRMSGEKFTGFKWAISITCLVYALWGTDFHALGRALASYSLPGMAATCIFISADYAFMGRRFQMLCPQGAGYGRALAATIIGAGYNSIFPARAGEVIKGTYLVRVSGYSWGEAGCAIFLERLSDVFCLAVVAAMAMLATDLPGIGWAPFAVVLVAAYFMLALRRYSSLLQNLYCRIPFSGLRTLLADVHLHSGKVLTPAKSWKILTLAGLIWALHYGAYYIILTFAAGFALTHEQVVIVFAAAALGMAVPAAPSGLGVFEGIMVFCLSEMGIDRGSALAAAIFIRFFYFVPIILPAFYLTRQSMKPREPLI